MPQIDPNKLLLAAKTSISMIGIIHETLWQLFPDELLVMIEADEEKLVSALCSALFQDQHAEQNPPPDIIETSDSISS